MHTFLLELTLIGIAVSALLMYFYAVCREKRRGRHWYAGYSLCFSCGIAALVVGLLPPVAAMAHTDLRVHMAQHVLLGMLAPLGLVLAAPMTLLLRSLPTPQARQMVKLLRADWLTVVSHPAGAMLLNVGGMYLLYMTPLYALSLTTGWLHGWMHLHFIVAGCIFTWAIAGPDPGPHRPGRDVRLLFLFASVGLHALLAKLMYAYGWPRGSGHGLDEVRAAAKVMYYGGDVAELLLIAAFFKGSFWLTRKRRPLHRVRCA